MMLYLAGPMSWVPAFNFPAFHSWMRALEYHGFEVLSPHLADPPHMQAIAWASPDGDPSGLPEGGVITALRNVQGISECDGIALIPGWQKSSGSIHEVATAVRFTLPVAPVQLWLACTNIWAEDALGLLSPDDYPSEGVMV